MLGEVIHLRLQNFLFCYGSFFSLTQSVYSFFYISPYPEVWSPLKHLQLNSIFHMTEMAQLDFYFQPLLWCVVPVLVPISAVTQHQNQILHSYYLYHYFFWLILPIIKIGRESFSVTIVSLVIPYIQLGGWTVSCLEDRSSFLRL